MTMQAELAVGAQGGRGCPSPPDVFQSVQLACYIPDGSARPEQCAVPRVGSAKENSSNSCSGVTLRFQMVKTCQK